VAEDRPWLFGACDSGHISRPAHRQPFDRNLEHRISQGGHEHSAAHLSREPHPNGACRPVSIPDYRRHGVALEENSDSHGFIGSLQTASGAYLAAFVTSHLMAVFVLGRWAMQIDTNWDFATGAPTGLMGDPWNVRLVPHYSLAVFLLFSHLACGLRAVLLSHHVAEKGAKGIARTVIALGGIAALVIISAMLGLHAVAR